MNVNMPANGEIHLPGDKRRGVPNRPTKTLERRHTALSVLPNLVRVNLVALCGELIGTFLFTFFAFAATQVANSVPGSQLSSLLYIALAFGFSLAVNVWVFFRISGGLFNPAVTFAMWLVGALPSIRAAIILLAQLLGATTAAAVVSTLFPGPPLFQVGLGSGTSIVRGLFIEMFLTFELVFAIFMLAAEKHKATFVAPIGIGLALFIAELAGLSFTGGALNPARAFAACVVAQSDHKFPGYHWIYWIGPLLGATLAAGFYKIIKILEYETANPGQDAEVSSGGYREERVAPKSRGTAHDGTVELETFDGPSVEGQGRGKPSKNSLPPTFYAGPLMENGDAPYFATKAQGLRR
ncbi:MAG: hypothetical protein M1834_003370 [Cirrosporium novae-zelandiae]|nr:MAG: hypothetical protein M1834_003370 [Cirrosporium novae-zelandiae]